MSMIMPADPKLADLATLRALIARRGPGLPAAPACPLGLPALDAALDGGLPRGCLQEVIPADAGASAAGFAAFLLGRLASAPEGGGLSGGLKGGGPKKEEGRGVLWASLGEGDLYPPALAAFGLDPGAVILLSAPSPAELLWGMEEALRSSVLAGVVGEVDRLDLTAGRRLQLAAAAGGGVGFLLLRADRPAAAVSAAALRWRVGAGPRRSWHVELLRRRGGRPGAWILEREDETDRLLVAAELGDGPAAPETRLSGR
jgi:protein ImuA